MQRLCGFPPFYEDANIDLFDQIKMGKYDFPSPQWDSVSKDAKDIINNLLVVEPGKRWDCEKLLSLPWVNQ